MANLGIRTDAGGTFGALTLGGFNIILIDPAINSYSIKGQGGRTDSPGTFLSSYTKPTASALTTVRFATANLVDTFDAGSVVNILYEG